MKERKLCVFDMDDTLIHNNKWFDLNTFLGVSEADDNRLYQDFKNEQISYKEWMDALDALYELSQKNVTRDEVTQVLQTYTVREGAGELVQTLHAAGYETAIITGSFAITAQSIADELGIKHVIANTHCVFDEHDRLTHIHSRGTEGTMKQTYLLELCSSLGIQPHENCYVIGDSIYDQPMFLATGKGITFTDATEELRNSALHTVDSFSDIQSILCVLTLLIATNVHTIV